MATAIDMEACMKAATPGEAHKKLEYFVGTWKAKVKCWMDPAGEPEESAGTIKNTWVLGKRYLRQDYSGEGMGGGPFEGTGYFGFNNVTGNYEGFWIDSMSTGMMTETGRVDRAGKVWTMTGEAEYPTAGAIMKAKALTPSESESVTTAQPM